MGINLQKGQTIDLRKPENGSVENNLSKVTIGLGWDINDNGSNYDLDAVAVLLDKDGKLTDSKDIVFYGDKKHTSGKIWLTGDNLTGAGEGDDEQIIVNLNELPAKYEKIVFFTSIYQGCSRNQELSKINNAYIRAVDGNNNEIAKYTISGDRTLEGKHSLVFAEAYRKDGGWKFRALGESHDTDSYQKIAESYKGKKMFGIF